MKFFYSTIYKIKFLFILLLSPVFMPFVSSQTGGTLDNSFATVGFTSFGFPQANATCSAAALQSDGKLILAGQYISGNTGTLAVVRLTNIGLPDSTFGLNGQVLLPFSNVNVEATTVQIVSDGSILIAGKSNNLPLLIKMSQTGVLSGNFGTGGILSFDNGLSGIIDLILLEDGKLLGCGKKADQFCVFKRNEDGSEELSFGIAGFSCIDAGPLSVLSRMTLQADGKILLTGSLNATATKNDIVVMRLTKSGSLDNTFNNTGTAVLALGNAGTDEVGNAIRVQKDGRIVVAGNFVDSSKTKFIVVRLLPEGVIDTSFASTGSVIVAFNTTKDEAKDLVIQADGRALVCGTTNTGNGSNVAMVRFKTDGKLDPNFAGLGKISSKIGNRANGEVVLLQPDNKIIVAGYAMFSNQNRFMAARYNPGVVVGTNEASKKKLSEIVLWPNPIQPGNKIYVQGNFTSSEQLRIKLTTLDGRQVHNWAVRAPQFENQVIELELPADLYPSAYLMNFYSNSISGGKLVVID
ncbi:MAG: hypothetical protein IPI45_00960 [Saprospiraceae bacterium]|nr:hypothetical protein [Saprospiraceae bacterium]MBK7736327.1 hypothetical protein [Saprospiraceae bacterium]MBK7912307.1 hypothetical protein [Saprospiraceae bacterium]